MTREEQLEKLHDALDLERFTHSLGVEATAFFMARRFKVDALRAQRAGRLHDCAKRCTLEEMRALVAASGEGMDSQMASSRALLHAPAGAALARQAYGETDEAVLRAIRWHTTGCVGMTELDKVIYLADMIEPGRKPYPGLEEIRALCQTDLDAAMRAALGQSIAHIRAKGQEPHPDTQAALDDFWKNLK